MRRSTATLAVLVVAAVLARCKSTTEPVVPASIVVTPVSLLLEVTASRQLTVRAYDAAGDEIASPKVVFVSTDEAVAPVDDQGRVTGVASGNCQIIVQAAANAQVAVTVPTTVTRFHVATTPAQGVLTPGATLQLSALVTADNGQPIPGVAISWSSTDGGVVSVTSAGTAQGVDVGYAGIVATVGLQGRDTAAIVVLHRIPVAGAAYGLDVAQNRLALVTLGNVTSVARIDLATRMVTATIAVGGAPTQVAFNAANDSAYVTNQTSGTVGVLNVLGGTQVGTIAVAADPFVVDVSPGGAVVYVTGNEGSVFVIDAATRSLDTILHAGGSPNGLAFHPTSPVLYVSTFQTGLVVEVNTADNTLGRQFALGGLPQSLAVSLDGQELYVANESLQRVHVLSTATGAVIGTIPLPGDAFGLALSPDGTTLYAGIPGAVAVINRAARTVERMAPVGGLPRRISFDPGTGRAVVANAAGWVDILP
ncbi:MAG: Ig-like domain-containing protein [Gemmatimonadales bacterium]